MITRVWHGWTTPANAPKAVRQLGRKNSIIIVESPIAFLPGFHLLTSQLFAKVFTNQRMSIEMPRIVGIFCSEESCSS